MADKPNTNGENNAKKERKAQTVPEVKAEAIKNKATEQVEPTASKTKKRRRYPFIKLLVILLCMALAAGYSWQYRQKEIDNKVSTIENLKKDAKKFEAEKHAAEEEKKKLEEQYTLLDAGTFTMRVPATWVEKATEYPQDEKVYGDENTTIRVINSETKNSIDNYIPTVDYLWQITEDNGAIKVLNQSLHCQRFDTINNDLNNAVREHNNFHIYCDTDAEKIVIGALSTPEKYGTENTNTYFIIEINDVQQANIDEIKTYLNSYTAR